MLKLKLFSLGCRGFCSYCGLYYQVGWFRPHFCREGYVKRRIHNAADVHVESSFLWRWKGHIAGVEDKHNFIDASIVCL